MNIFYKGEDIKLTFQSANNMSVYTTKAVKFFTFGGAPKTAVVAPVDDFTFTVKLSKADTADLPVGILNIVLELSTASGDKIISKTIDVKLNDPYLNGGERPATDLTADIVFAQGQALTVSFVDVTPITAEAIARADADTAEAIARADADTAEATARANADAAIIADEKAIAPQIAFNKRVLADGGTVRSKAFMQRVFEANKDLLANTELLYVPECGAKITDGKIEKLYNLVGANDAVQATAVNRFYIGGIVAPNEKVSVKNVIRQATSDMTFSEREFISADSFSIVLVVKPTKSGRIYTSSLSGIEIGDDYTYIEGEDGTMMSTPSCLKNGVYSVVEFSYTNAKGWISVNGVKGSTAASPKTIKFNRILSELTYGCSPEIAYFGIYNKALSASESQNLHAFLSAEFPAIETIAVGPQQVATSNLEATVFGGTVIPEVQDNTAWAALSTPAWCHYDNSAANGAIYGKLYNGYAITAINASAPQGFHVPSELEWTQLSESLGGNTVSGGKLKAKYGGFDNAFATNESGVSLLDSGYRGSEGDSVNTGIKFLGRSLDTGRCVYIGQTSIEAEIISVSVKYGASVRLFSNTPNLTTLLYTSGYVTTDILSGNLDIRTPFGCIIESIKIESETGITGLSASLLDYNKANGVSLLTAKTVIANTPINFKVNADQPSGYTDNYVRINGTKAVTSGRFLVTIKVNPIQ